MRWHEYQFQEISVVSWESLSYSSEKNCKYSNDNMRTKTNKGIIDIGA